MIKATKVLAAKKEATYGQWAGVTYANDAVITRNFQSQPIETDRLGFELDTGQYGATPGMVVNERQTMAFEMLLAGSGAAGTAPDWMPLLEGCGMAAPVVAAGVSATQNFALASDEPSSLSLLHNRGRHQRRGVGARGTWSLDMTANAFPFLALQLTALIPDQNAFADVPANNIDLTGMVQPVEVNTRNTAVTLGGYACVMRSLRLDAGVQTNIRSLVGARYVNSADHAVTGQIVIQAVLPAVQDYMATLREGDIIPLNVTHGIAAGNIVAVNAPRVQLTSLADSDEDGILMWTLGLSATIGVGGDDLTLVAT